MNSGFFQCPIATERKCHSWARASIHRSLAAPVELNGTSRTESVTFNALAFKANAMRWQKETPNDYVPKTREPNAYDIASCSMLLLHSIAAFIFSLLAAMPWRQACPYLLLNRLYKYNASIKTKSIRMKWHIHVNVFVHPGSGAING